MELSVLDGGGEVASFGERLARRRQRVCRRRFVANIGGQKRTGAELWVLPAGPDMHRVVRVLVEKPERGVVDIASAEISEVVEAQDLINVLSGRIMIMDALVDGLPALVFG